VRWLRAAALAVFASAPPCAAAQDGDAPQATVVVLNRSDHEIRHLYLTASESDDWGADRLGGRPLAALTGRLRISGIACDDYDVRLEGSDGASCEVQEVELCGRDEVWTITNEQLRACPGWEP
jgi:hypothetical protein